MLGAKLAILERLLNLGMLGAKHTAELLLMSSAKLVMVSLLLMSGAKQVMRELQQMLGAKQDMVELLLMSGAKLMMRW